MRAADHVVVQVPDDQVEGEHADGDVHQEDPAPRQVLREHAAERRGDHRRDTPDAGQVALDPAAFGDGVEVTGHGLDGAADRARADALHRAKQDQRQHVPGAGRQRRTEEEDGHAEDQDRFAAVEVGELAVDRDGHRLRQQVDREHPAHLIEAAEVTDHLRDGGRQDGGVHGHQGHGEDQRDQHRRARVVSKVHQVAALRSHCMPTSLVWNRGYG